MNAGSYGGQMSDVVREVSLFTSDGELHRRKVQPDDFAYRKSPFSNKEIIVEATFELTPSDPAALQERLKSIAQQRLGSQPPGERSAGCIFRNPEGDSAGRLVDSLGLKGMSVGGASISMIHGNFIVNRGDATPEDVIALIERVASEVERRSGVTLQREVILWD